MLTGQIFGLGVIVGAVGLLLASLLMWFLFTIGKKNKHGNTDNADTYVYEIRYDINRDKYFLYAIHNKTCNETLIACNDNANELEKMCTTFKNKSMGYPKRLN